MTGWLILFSAFIYGFIGLAPVGMINGTVLARSVAISTRNGIKFAFGAMLMHALQIFIAIAFIDYFVGGSPINKVLNWLAVVVFSLLSVYYFKRRNKHPGAQGDKAVGNPVIKGVMISSVNFLAIPYWALFSIWVENRSTLESVLDYWMWIIPGGFAGAFLILCLYALVAGKFNYRMDLIQKRINLGLSILFFVLAIATAWKTL